METKTEIIDHEEYQITTLDSGHVIKELKMTPNQLDILAARQEEPVDRISELDKKIDALIDAFKAAGIMVKA